MEPSLNTNVSGLVQGRVESIWVVVKITVPFWVLIIIRHLIFRVPKNPILIIKAPIL